jgi:hypothetical protein
MGGFRWRVEKAVGVMGFSSILASTLPQAELFVQFSLDAVFPERALNCLGTRQSRIQVIPAAGILTMLIADNSV